MHHGNLKEAGGLLRSLTANILVAVTPFSSRSPLHHAVVIRSLEMAALILDNGGDVNIAGSDGVRPLHLISVDRERETVPLLYFLIRNGADVHAADNSGKTALDYVVEGDEEYSIKRARTMDDEYGHRQKVIVHERIKGILRQYMS